MIKKKPKWEKPKLIVLVRGGHEERVLQGCKSGDPFVEGPVVEAGFCAYGYCFGCSEYSAT